MKKPENFNFRTVMDMAGITMSNENNWKIGQCLSRLAAKKGIEPIRILTAKTDPNPTVAAPHCIAHYPIEMLDEAVEYAKQVWSEDPDNNGSQLQLF